jgi:hypothetical protein
VSHLTPANVAVLRQLNADSLPDLCTVEAVTPTATATGGRTEVWAPVGAAFTDMPARLSMRGAPQEARGGNAREQAQYTVALDGKVAEAHQITTKHRLQLRSGPTTTPAWVKTLYVLAVDGPGSMNPFPMVWCTTTPQPGQ